MSRRNVVMVTFDSLRADHCSHLGYHRETTPNLDRLAEDGVTFSNAIAPASRTNPSVAGAFTGEPMVVRGRAVNPEHSRRHLARYGTLAETLANRGYATGAFCPNAYASRYFGFDRGFDRFEDFLFGTDRYQRVFERHLRGSNLATVLRNVRNFVRREEAFKTWTRYIDHIEDWVHDQPEPFFLWIFSVDTHFPYLTPRRYRRWSSMVEQYYINWLCNRLIAERSPELTAATVSRIVDIYDDSIRFGDALLAELETRLGEYDPVYVVFGDHGEALGERGVYGHYFPSLYEENIHVPLVTSEAVEGIAKPAGPISLTALPAIIGRVAGMRAELRRRPWAVASDYDGRNDRHQLAVRTGTAKQIATWHHGRVCHEATYDLQGRSVEGEALGDGNELAATLRPLLRRRKRHERELLAIRDAISTSG